MTTILTDPELLQRVASNDREAVALVVRRHLPAVYAAARRQVDRPDLADDIAQAVFLRFVEKAPAIGADTPIIGWLCEAVRYACLNVNRSHRRRLRHERLAARMRTTSTDYDSASSDEILSVVDECLASLRERDRRVIQLRFFGQLSLRELAQTLGTTEEGARKAVARGVEKLREALLKRGITASTSSISAVLLHHMLASPPAALAQTISIAATHHLASGASVAVASVISSKLATAALALAWIGLLGYAGSHLLNRPRTTAPTPLAAAAVNDDEAFVSAYTLPPDAVLARIKPPFPPGREAWYFRNAPGMRGQPMPTSVRFEWDGTLRPMGMFMAFDPDRQINLATVLNWIQIPMSELSLDTQWLDYPLPGDWIIRTGAEHAAMMHQLSAILSEEVGSPVRFVRKTESREVAVVSGDFNASPGDRLVIELDRKPTGLRWPLQGQFSADMLYQLLAVASGWVILADFQPPPNVIVEMDAPASDHAEGGLLPPLTREELIELIGEVSEQTGQTFRIEIRPLEQWHLEEIKPE